MKRIRNANPESIQADTRMSSQALLCIAQLDQQGEQFKRYLEVGMKHVGQFSLNDIVRILRSFKYAQMQPGVKKGGERAETLDRLVSSHYEVLMSRTKLLMSERDEFEVLISVDQYLQHYSILPEEIRLQFDELFLNVMEKIEEILVPSGEEGETRLTGGPAQATINKYHRILSKLLVQLINKRELAKKKN